MKRRKKTGRNVLAALLLMGLSAALLLAPYGMLRWKLWTAAPEGRILWWGSLPYEMLGSTPWLSGIPIVFATDGEKLLSCYLGRYEGEAYLSGVTERTFPECGEVMLIFPGWEHDPREKETLDILAAVQPPEGTKTAEVAVQFPDGQVRWAEGKPMGEIVLFHIPGIGEELTSAEANHQAREALRHSHYWAAYRDANGQILLETKGVFDAEADET